MTFPLVVWESHSTLPHVLYNRIQCLLPWRSIKSWSYVNAKLFFMYCKDYQVPPSPEKPVPQALLFLIVGRTVRGHYEEFHLGGFYIQDVSLTKDLIPLAVSMVCWLYFWHSVFHLKFSQVWFSGFGFFFLMLQFGEKKQPQPSYFVCSSFTLPRGLNATCSFLIIYIQLSERQTHFSTARCERIGTMYATTADMRTSAIHLRS